MSIVFNIIGIRKYVIKRLYITSVTQFHELVISNDCNTMLRHKAGQEGRGEILLENSFMR